MTIPLHSLFSKVEQDEPFDAIKIGIASPERFVPGPMVKSKNPKQLTIELSNRNATVCSAQRFSGR